MAQTFTKHSKCDTRLYSIWENIIQRTYNKNNTYYKNYGGRGIKVCDEWRNNFMTFYKWALINGYKDNLTIDRIDVDGNYELNNCRWVDRKQQMRNTRRNRYFNISGETHCLKEWCEIYNLKYDTVDARIRRNWTIEEALELNERGCTN